MEPSAELTVGQRIQLHREGAGKTRAVLGGLVGRSAEWVKAVEKGRILPPRLDMLDRIAQALRVSIADLVGDPSIPPNLLTGPSHPALPAVRDALNRYPLGNGRPQRSLGDIRTRLEMAWRARHGSPDHRTVLGAILPDLIMDAQVAVHAREGEARREAYALLSGVLALTQFFVAYQPDAALAWRVKDRAMVAAQESGDPHAIGEAAWLLCEGMRDAGDWEGATSIGLQALRMLEGRLDDDDDLLGLYGILQTGVALTAATAGEEGRAWHHWDEADRVAQRLPIGYRHPHTWFSAPVVVFYAVSVATELRKAGEALRHAVRISPDDDLTSRPRRARHLIEVVRAHHLKGDHAETMATLNRAYGAAPETIRYNGYARQITLDLLDGPASIRSEARDLAVKVGLLTQG